MIAYYGHRCNYQLTPEQESQLRYWLYLANAKGRYSRGSTETVLDQDLSRIRDGRGIDSLIDAVRTQFGKLDIEPAELEGRNARSSYFKTMFLAFREDGAKDWGSNLSISLSHSGRQHKLQFHHVFPKALVSKRYRPAAVNDIANLAFLGGKTNRRISNKPPAKYLSEVLDKQGNAAFKAQCIPSSPQLLSIDSYEEFLAERRRLIASRLNEFLNTAKAT